MRFYTQAEDCRQSSFAIQDRSCCDFVQNYLQDNMSRKMFSTPREQYDLSDFSSLHHRQSTLGEDTAYQADRRSVVYSSLNDADSH